MAFQRLTVLRPDSARAFHQLGTAQQANGDTRSALASYERALALEPDPDTWSNVGVLLYAEGHFGDAAASILPGRLRCNPKEPIVQRNLGDAQAHLGRAEEARAAYRRASSSRALSFASTRTMRRTWAGSRCTTRSSETTRRRRRPRRRQSSRSGRPRRPVQRRGGAGPSKGEAPEAITLLSRAFAAGFSASLSGPTMTSLPCEPRRSTHAMSPHEGQKQGGVK